MNGCNNYLLSYNQHRVAEIYWKFRDKRTGASTACAVCSCAKLISDMLVPYFPFQLINLFDENNLFSKDNDGLHTLIKWSGFHEIWKTIYSIPYLYSFDRIHKKISTIRPPSIISIDGNRFLEGYQSHFLYAVKWIYAGNKIVNLEVWDPWYDRSFLFIPTYCKNINQMQDKIYSIINFKRETA